MIKSIKMIFLFPQNCLLKYSNNYVINNIVTIFIFTVLWDTYISYILYYVYFDTIKI